MSTMTTFIDRAIASRYAAIGSALALIALPFALLFLFLPALSKFAMQHITPTLERRLGEYILNELASIKDAKALSLSDTEQNRYRQRALELAKLADLEEVKVVFLKGQLNAVALPGNIIVVYEDLIRLYEKNSKHHAQGQVDAIIAHELGHLKHRHNIQQLVSQSVLSYYLFNLTGYTHEASSTSSALASLFLMSAMSREHETEADQQSFKLLTDSGQSAIRFAEAMCYLSRETKAKNNTSSFTASHPNSPERILSAYRYAHAQQEQLSPLAKDLLTSTSLIHTTPCEL